MGQTTVHCLIVSKIHVCVFSFFFLLFFSSIFFFFFLKETETCLKPQAQNIGEKRLNLLFDACDDSSAAMCLRAQ